jgi:tetratricopeptide (TPR) repeat protein
MTSRALDEAVHSKIRQLCADGDALATEKRFQQAFNCYREALMLVPPPAEDWEATTWIVAAIGDLYFAAGKLDKSLAAFEDAVQCPGGFGNPFIHLRLGQCCLDLGQNDRAVDELTRAYMGGSRDIFEEEDPKYFTFLETHIKPPAGQGSL